MAASREFASELGEPERRSLLALGHARTADAGEVLLSEGEAADRVLVLVAGRVKVTSATRTGVDAVLGFRGPGALLGDLAAFDDRPRSATVTAIEPVEYVSVAASTFRRHLRENADIAIALIVYL